MRVLLDENVDRRLKRAFPHEHEVVTVVEPGWAGKKNGELLKLAEKDFDASSPRTRASRTHRTSRTST
ncbi:hypothetical protein BH23ACT11_BH23ACT11_10470 [soil metagenome]